MFTLNCKGNLLMITEPLVMGIVNATPDSFYTSHATPRIEKAHELAQKMIAAGADIIDIGGQSTRPGSERIGPEEEIERVIHLIKKLADTNPGTILSIDTYHHRVVVTPNRLYLAIREAIILFSRGHEPIKGDHDRWYSR